MLVNVSLLRTSHDQFHAEYLHSQTDAVISVVIIVGVIVRAR